MLIATFNERTGWAGKAITYENGVFSLEDFGALTADAVMQYDRQGHLSWSTEGTRAWVGSMTTAAAPSSAPGATTAPAQESLIATFRPSTAWVGKRITYSGQQFVLDGEGPITAQAVLAYDGMGHLAWATDQTRAWVRAQAGTKSSNLMWLAAFGPLWVGLLLAAVPLSDTPPFFFALLIAPFIVLMVDWERLKKVGVDTSWLLLWAIVFSPAYIYLRQRRTHQTMGPLYLWIACFLISLPLPFAAAGGGG